MNAIITAAGWKGAGEFENLPGCPEPFLPLGNGQCPLSRTATILNNAGFDIYIAIGKRGYPFHAYHRADLVQTDRFDWSGTPWTQERYDYASQFGTVIEIDNPGGWSTSVDTFCEAMDTIGQEKWDRLFLACGDMVIPNYCLEYIITCEPSFAFTFTAYHCYFYLEQKDAEFWREYAEPFRRFDNRESWMNDKIWSPNYEGVAVLRENGIRTIDHMILPEQRWTDVDSYKTLKVARRFVADRNFDAPDTRL